MLKRKIDKVLIDWKNSYDKKPLIVKGMRQVGKTTSIRNFSKNYKCYVEINFALKPYYKDIFKGSYEADDIIKKLTLIDNNIEVIENNTLILFDEIQEFPDALTSFKSFYENKKYDVIASGSLLGINYQNISSVPVGFKCEIEMKSLDFEEFLWAKGYDSSFIDELFSYLLNLKPLPVFYFDLLNNLFNEYLYIGGLPEVVNKYCNADTYSGLFNLQDDLCLTYKNDIEKYALSLDKSKILFIYDNIINQLAKDNHKFQYTMLGHGSRYYQYYPCIKWIEDAGLINIVYNLRDLKMPLSLNKIENNYRIYFSDTTLFINKLDKQDKDKIFIYKNFEIFNGAFYENVVCEALAKQNIELYFYKNENATVELDFVVRVKDDIVPIEVKRKRGRSNSLNFILQNSDLPYGIKLSNSNIGLENKIITIPYSLTFLLSRFFNESNLFKYHIDD